MAKAKSPKLHFSLLTSLQLCRPKKPCAMIKSPLQPHVPLSPLNSKTFDISFPGTPIPIPPPSTPSSSRVAPLHPEDPDWRVPSPRNDSKKSHKSSKSCISRTPCSSSGDSNEEEKEAKKHRARRFKRYGSKEWKEGEGCSDERRPMLGRLAPCMVSMEQSFVVVKKSVDPYEDFKKSMSEMIVANHIFEPKELEQLLMSFLSLNSTLHHKIIIQAFTQILKELFCG
ncbi:transcription repressor OFP8-like [Salvia miltiorrhiza]|uniref:transcription repressor OFP8-like n=1 Tax=Salvia miltiorrhiza TaxID=226208 RepID=UPI0025ACAE71|nr:transcription repressor OFP8-like [Salvia miltiorrhiza]